MQTTGRQLLAKAERYNTLEKRAAERIASYSWFARTFLWFRFLKLRAKREHFRNRRFRCLLLWLGMWDEVA